MMEKSYIKGTGNFQKIYDSLLLLIPKMGSCQTLELELFRLTVRLYNGFYDKAKNMESRELEFRQVAQVFNETLITELHGNMHDIIIGKFTEDNLELLMDRVVIITDKSRQAFSGDEAKDWESIATELFTVLADKEITELQRQAMARFEKCKSFYRK